MSQNIIHKIKLAIISDNLSRNKSHFNSYFDYGENFSDTYQQYQNFRNDSEIQFHEWSAQFQEYFENHSNQWKIVVIILYSLIVIVSFFGNSIVCKIVFCNSAMKSTTNICIGNLSISDILMTVLNIPIQLTRILSRNWPLGQFLCTCLPFLQCLSVNVSSFTMAYIALDRYYVIVYPLRPRASARSVLLKLVLIWGIATLVSSPFLALTDVQNDITISRVIRCRVIYPDPEFKFRQLLTLITLFIQYLIPLCIIGVTYFRICYILWYRRNIGMMSEKQRIQKCVSKWKTIKMLIVVFIVFAMCWCPLNIYSVYQDFRGEVGHNKHNSYIFLTCHWFAMSSVCYNPFLYCWLNDKFRSAAKSCMRCTFITLIHSGVSSKSSLTNRILRKKVIKQASNTSALSSSLNKHNTNKTIFMSESRGSQQLRNKETIPLNNSKDKEIFILQDLEVKEHSNKMHCVWEDIHLLMKTKKTVL